MLKSSYARRSWSILLIFPPMKTRILQSFHLFLLVSRYGISKVRPDSRQQRWQLQPSACPSSVHLAGQSCCVTLTSIIKQPPHVHRPLPLLILELLTGLQQPLVGHVQRNSRALLVCYWYTEAASGGDFSILGKFYILLSKTDKKWPIFDPNKTDHR